MVKHLAAITFLLAGCAPAQIGQIATALQGALPGASQPASTSLKKITGASLTLSKDRNITLFTVYESNKFDLVTGTEGTSEDFGQVQFMAWSGLSDKESNGYFLYGRQYVNQPIDVGFVEKGEVPFGSIQEAPEFGWSVGEVDKRNKVKLTANHVYLIRVKYRGTNETYFGKIWIKDIVPSLIQFDYSIQLTPDNRKLE